MVKVLLAHIIITMNTVTAISKDVWPWEVPVYEEKYGDGCFVDHDKAKEVEVDELPGVDEEYARMAQAFGQHPETKQGYVERVYGHGRSGIAALEKEIAAAEVKEKPKAKAKVKADNAAKDSDELARKPAGADDEGHDANGSPVSDDPLA